MSATVRLRSRTTWLKGQARAAVVAAAALAGWSVIVPLLQTDPVSGADALAAYARVLQRFVNERGEVDFAALVEDRRACSLRITQVQVAPDSGKLRVLASGGNPPD